MPPEDVLPLAEAIREVKETVGQCEVCFNLAVGPRCRICEDARRDPELICVVEEPGDVIPIERTNEWTGRYHVLGGALSPIDGVDPEDLHITELVGRVTSDSPEAAAGGVRLFFKQKTAYEMHRLADRGQVTGVGEEGVPV